jgi:hypothetical protein
MEKCYIDAEPSSPIPVPKMGNAKDIGMCSMAVVSIWGDGLTPGIDKRNTHLAVQDMWCLKCT